MGIKKIIAAGAGAAVVLSMAVPAFAWFDGPVIINKAKVKNKVVTVANTGLNRINSGDEVEGGKIKTGQALSWGEVNNAVNTNGVDCGCEGLIVNKAKVKNKVYTIANTGANSINADEDVDGGRIRTGKADATSVVTNVVNTNVVGGEE